MSITALVCMIMSSGGRDFSHAPNGCCNPAWQGLAEKLASSWQNPERQGSTACDLPCAHPVLIIFVEKCFVCHCSSAEPKATATTKFASKWKKSSKQHKWENIVHLVRRNNHKCASYTPKSSEGWITRSFLCVHLPIPSCDFNFAWFDHKVDELGRLYLRHPVFAQTGMATGQKKTHYCCWFVPSNADLCVFCHPCRLCLIEKCERRRRQKMATVCNWLWYEGGEAGDIFWHLSLVEYECASIFAFARAIVNCDAAAPGYEQLQGGAGKFLYSNFVILLFSRTRYLLVTSLVRRKLLTLCFRGNCYRCLRSSVGIR